MGGGAKYSSAGRLPANNPLQPPGISHVCSQIAEKFFQVLAQSEFFVPLAGMDMVARAEDEEFFFAAQGIENRELAGWRHGRVEHRARAMHGDMHAASGHGGIIVGQHPDQGRALREKCLNAGGASDRWQSEPERVIPE